MKYSACLLVFLLFACSHVFSQTNSERAAKKGDQAIELMDSGKTDESLQLLKECMQLDPGNIIYPYESAYAYYLKKEYAKSIEILTGLLVHKDCFGRVYQLLGNSYDLNGQREKAVSTYEDGIKRFPSAGELYLERANMELMQKRYTQALPYYEKGIEMAPGFSSNYYWAAKIYCGSTEEVKGMIYGEIFMNIERNSDRTAEISKLLFDTYKSEIKLMPDSSYSVSFSKSAAIDMGSFNGGNKMKPPFGMGVYEPLLLLALKNEETIDINSLDRIRTSFMERYFNGSFDKAYPNALFDYQKRIADAGHFEAYHHWLLLKGDEITFNFWLARNKVKWDGFMQWFAANPMKPVKSPQF